MKLYKICNKISLLLHALCSAAGYFLIEAISRHSFTDAWTYMTGKPLVFAYNAGLIFTHEPDCIFVPPKNLLACSGIHILAASWNYQWRDPGKQGHTVYRPGSASAHRRYGSP